MTSAIIIWTLGMATLLWWFASEKKWKVAARIVAASLAAITVIAALPSSGTVQPPTQVVYRFDDHRYLEMTGWRCEGAVYYIDASRNIRGEIFSQFARVLLLPITHADDDGDFIYIPYNDLGGFRVSIDHGKTFDDSIWIGSRPGIEEIKKVTVINRQAFLEGKDGRLFMTSKPIGSGWGSIMIDTVNELPNTVFRDRIEFQGIPKSVPPVKNYKGWTEMHCDPSRAGALEKQFADFEALKSEVISLLGHTVAFPVTLAMNVVDSTTKH